MKKTKAVLKVIITAENTNYECEPYVMNIEEYDQLSEPDKNNIINNIVGDYKRDHNIIYPVADSNIKYTVDFF